MFNGYDHTEIQVSIKNAVVTADQAAEQANQRHAILVEAHRDGRLFHRIRRVALHATIARFVRGLGRVDKFAWSVELRRSP